jgi:hypothetical protein
MHAMLASASWGRCFAKHDSSLYGVQKVRHRKKRLTFLSNVVAYPCRHSRQRIGIMFKFLPTPTLPGFRVGLVDDDTPGFNVPTDGSRPPVLPDAPDVPTVDDNYPFRATPLGFNVPQAPSPNPAAPAGIGLPLPPAANQTPTDPTPSAGSLPLDPPGSGGVF